MISHLQHLIVNYTKIKEALARLNELGADAILFVINQEGRLLGSLTDGDVRRGFLKGLTFDNNVEDFIQPSPRFLQKGSFTMEQVIEYRTKNFRIIPVIDDQQRVVNVINFRFLKSYLPVDAVIMAGGRGERLKPLTDTIPKPLLPVGSKAIIEHNVDRLISYGIDDLWVTVRYKGDLIKEYFLKNGKPNVSIQFINENEPLGTVGAVGLIQEFKSDVVLITNSDLLTDVDYEDFYLDFLKKGAAISVLTIPYSVNIPYAVLETSNGHIINFKEKPTYTYYSNGGVYLVQRDVLKHIPKNAFYNATDLMKLLIEKGYNVNSYPLRGYWLDIGRHEDYTKAQDDITHLKL